MAKSNEIEEDVRRKREMKKVLFRLLTKERKDIIKKKVSKQRINNKTKHHTGGLEAQSFNEVLRVRKAGRKKVPR